MVDRNVAASHFLPVVHWMVLLLVAGMLITPAFADPQAPQTGGEPTDLRARLLATIDEVAASRDYLTLKTFLAADDATTAGLAALLDDPTLTPLQRYVATVALSWVRTPAALAALLAHADDAHPLIRQGVAYGLGMVQDDTGEARKTLTRLAQEDPFRLGDKQTGQLRYPVRDVAQRSLSNLDKAGPLQTAGARPGTGGPAPAAAAPTPAASPADAAMTAAVAFLADPALPTFAKRDARFPFKPEPRNPFWRLSLEAGHSGLDSYLCVAEAGDKIIDYLSGLPAGPYPETIMPQADCQEIATQFARRQLPAMFADGGEVKCDPQADLSRKTGGYVFDFSRVQQGMRVLPKAVVGVRGYDGKVVQWTSDHQTLNIPLKPNLTLEQALDSLKAYLADFKWVPGMVLESGLEVVTFKRQQRLAWNLKIEIHGARNAKEDTLDGFCFCHVDANDGAVLDRQFPAVGVDTYRWYQAKGGKHIAMIETRLPESLFADAYPMLSPDGKRLLLYSTRTRSGYPEWLVHRPSGLCIAGADGSDLTCLVSVDASQAAWGPKSDRVAYLNKDIIVLNLSTGERTVIPSDRDHQYAKFVWLLDGKLVVVSRGQQMKPQLLIIDPEQPQAPPVPLSQVTALEIGGLAVDHQGRLLYATKSPTDASPNADAERNKAPYSLYRLDLRQEQSQPELLMSYLVDAQRLVLSSQGRVYLMSPAGSCQVVDLAAKSISTWQPPRVTCPDSTFRTSVMTPMTDLSFAADGSLLFSADYFSGKAGDVRAQVIYACGADGSSARLLTKPEKGDVAQYRFPSGR